MFGVENRNPERDGVYTVQFNTVQGSAIQSTSGGTHSYNDIRMIALQLLLLCSEW